MSEEFFVALKDDANPDVVYRLKTEWYDSSCNIVILVHDLEGAAYRGKITEEEAEIQGKERGYSSKEYIRECKESLNPKRNAEEFSYQIQGKSFIIKKNLKGKKSIKIRLAEIELDKVDFLSTVFNMFDGAMKQIEDLTNKNDDLDKEKAAILKSYDVSVVLLNETKKLKKDYEDELYTKFLRVLNPKKKRIAELSGQSMPSSSGTREELEATEMDYDSNDSVYSDDTNVGEEEMEELPEERMDEILPSSSAPNQEMEEKRGSPVHEEVEDKLESNPEPISQNNIVDSSSACDSAIEDILNSMPFLDPTKPLKKKS